ncbi:MAG: hypothetical protein EBS27_02060 [Actinobacteria bacterium]|nr:hypothetical protein [Actinomycetota bacterium]
MRAVGVRGGAWLGGVNAWGDVFVDGQERLRWFVAADDRWYRPSRETTVRQREVSGVPVIETRIKVPGGDAVQRVYGVADLGGAIVVEIYNDSSLPFAVAFDRGDIATMREPSPTGVQGIDLPAGMAALHVASRVDVPEASWSNILTKQRCKLLLSAGGGAIAGTSSGGSGSGAIAGIGDGDSGDDSSDDFVDLILDRAERVKLGDRPGEWVDEVARAAEQVLQRCAKRGSTSWLDERAILSAGMLLHRAGEIRGQQDVERAWSRLLGSRVAETASARVDGEINSVGREAVEKYSGVRQIAWVESQLVARRHDGVIEICPRGIDTGWLGANFECHRLVASTEHLISFAVRWHGEKPALLWEIDGPPGARVAASAIDRAFSSTEMRGETLLAGFTAEQTALVK